MFGYGFVNVLCLESLLVRRCQSYGRISCFSSAATAIALRGKTNAKCAQRTRSIATPTVKTIDIQLLLFRQIHVRPQPEESGRHPTDPAADRKAGKPAAVAAVAASRGKSTGIRVHVGMGSAKT